MKVVQCANGHFYDSDKYSGCPHCEKLSGNVSVSLSGSIPVSPVWSRQPEPVDNRFDSKSEGTVLLSSFSQSMNINNNVSPVARENVGAPMTTPICRKCGNPINTGSKFCAKCGAPVEISNSEYSNDDNKTVLLNIPNLGKDENNGIPNDANNIGAAVVPPMNPYQQVPSRQPVSPVRPNMPLPATPPVQRTPMSSPGSPIQPAPVRNGEQVKKQGAGPENIPGAKAPVSGQKTQVQEIKPIVGWIVSIRGSLKGSAYSLYNGKNSVGSFRGNTVVISGDKDILPNVHAWIAFDPNKNFFVLPGGKETFVNGALVTKPTYIKQKDIIEMGSNKFLFVPLAAKDFDWDSYMESK